MRYRDLKDKIIKLLEQYPDTTFTSGKIASTLKIEKNLQKKFEKCLNRMLVKGAIIQDYKKRYSMGTLFHDVEGIIDVLLSGNSFVRIPDIADKIFIKKYDTGVALPGDKVLVRIGNGKNKDKTLSIQGKVLRVVSRCYHDIVGTLKSGRGGYLYVVPLNETYKYNFIVSDSNGAKINDRVVMRFNKWENRKYLPHADIIEVIGPENNPSLDTISIIRQYGLNKDFSSEVMIEAETASELMKTPGTRIDLRDKMIFTIDPERARDFDDALSLEECSNGNKVLGVHIADVSHFIKRNGALDKEASKRGNSVYFSDKVIPMLPEQLSNGICSLKPGKDRLTISVFLTIDSSGTVVGRKFAKTVIKSKYRFTYEEVMKIISEPTFNKRDIISAESNISKSNNRNSHEAASILMKLSLIARQFRRKRFATYALDLDLPESEIIMGDDDMIADIRLLTNDFSHQLVEECMIAANEAVAIELSNNAVPMIFRVHEPPHEEKIQELSSFLALMKYKPGNLNHRKNLSRFLKSIKNDPLAYHIRLAVLKSMSKAVYSVIRKEHFGLSKKFYTHFTSPIRRYSDLIVHYQLSRTILSWQRKGLDKVDKNKLYTKDELIKIADDCSHAEQKAEVAERALTEIKIYRFLEEKLKRKSPDIYDAVIVDIKRFGFFVELINIRVQGLVHISTIRGMGGGKSTRGKSKAIKFNNQMGNLRKGKHIYKTGEKVKVFVVKVDFENKRIDFVLA